MFMSCVLSTRIVKRSTKMALIHGQGPRFPFCHQALPHAASPYSISSKDPMGTKSYAVGY